MLCGWFQLLNVLGLQTLRAFDRIEFNSIVLRQSFESGPLYRRMVDENIHAIILGYESETFLVVEPFNRSFRHLVFTSLSLVGTPNRRMQKGPQKPTKTLADQR